jgi:hypothetical protein
MGDSPEAGGDWLGQPPLPDTQTRLNYVIPAKLEHLLGQYCTQTEMKSGPLVRRLVSDFLKGEIGINVEDLEHPKGRRTSVDLPGRLLAAFETRCEEIGAPTKAAVIAALLGDFLPPRVDTDGIEKIRVDVPTSIYSKIYERYGPGPDDEVIVDALCDLIQKNQSRAIPAEQEA